MKHASVWSAPFEPKKKTVWRPGNGAVLPIKRCIRHKLGRTTHIGANLLNLLRINREETTHVEAFKGSTKVTGSGTAV